MDDPPSRCHHGASRRLTVAATLGLALLSATRLQMLQATVAFLKANNPPD